VTTKEGRNGRQKWQSDSQTWQQNVADWQNWQTEPRQCQQNYRWPAESWQAASFCGRVEGTGSAGNVATECD